MAPDGNKPQEELQQAKYAEHSMQQELRDHQQQMASLQQALDQAERAKTALSHQVKCCVLMLVARAPPLGQ